MKNANGKEMPLGLVGDASVGHPVSPGITVRSLKQRAPDATDRPWGESSLRLPSAGTSYNRNDKWIWSQKKSIPIIFMTSQNFT